MTNRAGLGALALALASLSETVLAHSHSWRGVACGAQRFDLLLRCDGVMPPSALSAEMRNGRVESLLE